MENTIKKLPDQETRVDRYWDTICEMFDDIEKDKGIDIMTKYNMFQHFESIAGQKIHDMKHTVER